MKFDSIQIAVDGSHSPTTKEGSWAFIVYMLVGGNSKAQIERYGVVEDTTNNAMELEAVRKALSFLPVQYGIPIQILTDSSYVYNGFTKWMLQWSKNQIYHMPVPLLNPQ